MWSERQRKPPDTVPPGSRCARRLKAAALSCGACVPSSVEPMETDEGRLNGGAPLADSMRQVRRDAAEKYWHSNSELLLPRTSRLRCATPPLPIHEPRTDPVVLLILPLASHSPADCGRRRRSGSSNSRYRRASWTHSSLLSNLPPRHRWRKWPCLRQGRLAQGRPWAPSRARRSLPRSPRPALACHGAA